MRYFKTTARLIAVALIVSGCRESPKPAANPTTAETAQAPAAPVEELGAVTLDAGGAPSGVELITLDEKGGTIEKEGVAAVFQAGEIAGTVQVGLATSNSTEELPEDWKEKVTSSGQRFSLVTRGDGAIRAGKFIITIDPAKIPEGSTPYLVAHTGSARAEVLPTNRSSVPLRVFKDKQAPPDSKVNRAVADYVRAAQAGMRDDELLAFACSSVDETGKLVAPITTANTRGKALEYEMVYARDLKHDHVKTEREPIACVFYLYEPVHDRDEYQRRLADALRRARRHAESLNMPLPAGPVAITITDQVKTQPIGGSHSEAHVGGTNYGPYMVLRRDLLAQWPRGEPSLLEHVVAHEYFHVIQSHCMTLDTWESRLNDWGVEGGAEWFAHDVYKAFPQKMAYGEWVAPLDGLEAKAAYNAAPFWVYLHERFGDDVMTRTLTLLQQRTMTEGLKRLNDPSLQIAFGLRLEYSAMTEALDLVLRRYDSSLSAAFADFSAAYLYRRDFATDSQGTSERPGLWHGLEPFAFPAQEHWTQRTLRGATEGNPAVNDSFTVSELSARAIRYTEHFDRGTLNVTLKEVKTFMGMMEPSFCRELGPPRVRMYLFGERAGQEPKLLHDQQINEPDKTLELRVENFGHGGEYQSAVVVLVNTGWQIRRNCPGSSQISKSRMGDLSYRLRAYLSDRQPTRKPTETYVHNVPSGGKRWCISKDRSEDGDGNRCFGTFAAAISNKEVEDGHELIVDPGTYEEQVVVTKRLVIKPKIPGTVTIKVPKQQVVAIAVPDVTIANFILVGGQSLTPVVGINNGAYNANIWGNVIVSGGPGVGAYQAAGATVARNWIAGTQAGVKITESDGSIVQANIIAPIVGNPRLDAPDIQGHRIEVPGDFGESPGVIDGAIEVSRSSGVTVAENESLTWNWVATGAFDSGLEASNAPGLSVKNNLFRTDASPGIHLYKCSGVVLAQNRLVGHIGLQLTECDEVVLNENVIEGLFNGVTMSDARTINSSRNHFIGGATAWGMGLDGVSGLSSTEDVIEGGGGVGTASPCQTLVFTRTNVRGIDTAVELKSASNAMFDGCTLMHVNEHNDASAPGEGGGLRSTGSDQVLVRDTTFRGPMLAAWIEDGAHATWEKLRLVDAAAAGIAAGKTSLNLRDVKIHPRTHEPLSAMQGELMLEKLEFAMPGCEPVAALPKLALRPGLLRLEPIHQETAYRVTPLTPWWWTMECSGDDADYALRYELDLTASKLPTDPRPGELCIIVTWGDEYYLPGEVVNGVVKASVGGPDRGEQAGNRMSFGVVLEPPEPASPKKTAHKDQ